MLETEDATALTLSTALRDLADRVDEAHEGETVVCVIGSGVAAKIFVLSGDTHTMLASTAGLLEAVAASLETANRKVN